MSKRLIKAVFVAVVRDGELLMIQEGGRARGRWGLPGGHVDEGESVEEAAVREVREEAGCTVELGTLLEQRTIDGFAYQGKLSEDGDDIAVSVFRATALSEASRQEDTKELAVRWVPLNEVTALPLRWSWLPEILKLL